MLRVLVLVAVTACVVSGAILPPSIKEDYSIIPEEVPIIDRSVSVTGHTETAQAIAYDVRASYGGSSGAPGSYTVSESAVTAIAASYGGSSGAPGTYAVTEYAQVASYGVVESSSGYGSRRLLDTSDPTAATGAGPSKPQTVLRIDVPDDFNPEDNSLVLSFSGEWAHTISSSFNAAFALELLDSEATEVLSFEGPTLHHRCMKASQPRQRRKPFTLQYSTVFNDVLLTPGEQAVLRLSSEGSIFTDFSATVDLTWRFENSPETVTRDTHGAWQQRHYPASTVGNTKRATRPGASSKLVAEAAQGVAYAETQLEHHITTTAGKPATMLTRHRRQLLEDATPGAYGGEQSDLYSAITEAAGPGMYGGQPGLSGAAAGAGTYGGEEHDLYGSITEAAGPGVYGGQQSDLYGAITEAAGPGVYGGQQPGLNGAATKAAGASAYGGEQHSQNTFGGLDNQAGAVHLGKVHGSAGGKLENTATNSHDVKPNKKKAEPIVDIQDQLHVLDEKHNSESIPYTNSENSDNMQTATAALLGQRPVPWSYPTPAVGNAPVPAAVHKPSAPGPIQAPDAPAQPALQPTPISAPAIKGTSPAASAATAVQEPGQAGTQYAMHPVEAVPLPGAAFADDGGTSSGCMTKFPRGLQCGGTGGLCEQHGEVRLGLACRDEPYADACCASGTVCTRKSEELWVCAPKLPGHGFVRRLLA